MRKPKYKCERCGAEFDKPGKGENHLEYWGAPCVEEYACCPYCGGDFYEIEDEESEDEEE